MPNGFPSHRAGVRLLWNFTNPSCTHYSKSCMSSFLRLSERGWSQVFWVIFPPPPSWNAFLTRIAPFCLAVVNKRPSTRKCSFAFLCANTPVLHHFGRPFTRILKTQWLKTHFFGNESKVGKIQKRSLPVLMWMVNLHAFQFDDVISPTLDR